MAARTEALAGRHVQEGCRTHLDRPHQQEDCADLLQDSASKYGEQPGKEAGNELVDLHLHWLQSLKNRSFGIEGPFEYNFASWYPGRSEVSVVFSR